MKKFLQPYEKLGLSEIVYLSVYTKGYYSNSGKCTYEKGSALRKAFFQGRRDAKKIY